MQINPVVTTLYETDEKLLRMRMGYHVKQFKVNNNCNNTIFFHFDPNGNLKNRVDEPQQKIQLRMKLTVVKKKCFKLNGKGYSLYL